MIGINRLLGLFCGLACLFALAFCACESAVPENCGDGSRLNPETEFCFGGQAYPKCGVGEYDPTVNKCENGVLKSKCGVGDKFYDPAAEFCAGDTVYSKCLGEEYDPASQKCESNVLKSQCGNDYYDTTAAFCVGDTVYSKCGGYTYDPAAATCENNVLKGKCGGIDYNPATENCSGGVISPITYTLTVSADPAVAGSVSREPDAESYNAGTSVTVTATPAAGYTFTGWTGASTATANVVQITMNGNKTLTANFQRQTVSPADTCAANPKPGCPNYVPPITPTAYTITFNYYYSGSTYTTATTDANGKLASLPTPIRSGYNFDGWYTAATGGTMVTESWVYSANVTIYARWTVIPITPPLGGTFTDERDGTIYKKITIGTQTWMAENLNYDIPESDDGTNLCYENSADNCEKYGRLYRWYTAMDIDESYYDKLWNGSDINHQGICPVGWHLPSDAEWDTLVNFVGDSLTAGKKLKSQNGWRNNGNGTDEYGFSALPGGRSTGGSSFYNAFEDGYWWSATEAYNNLVWIRNMDNSGERVRRHSGNSGYKSYMLSVRCVQDE